MRKDISRPEQTGKDKNKDAGKRMSRCPVSRKCGGCTMIDMPLDRQLSIKQEWVEECIGRFGHVETMIKMKNPGRYRNKVTSVFALDRKGKPICGVYRGRSHEVVPVKDCLIEDRRADAIIQTIYQSLRSFKYRVYDEDSGFGWLRAVQVRTAHATGQIMVTMVTNDQTFPSRHHFIQYLLEKHPDITTIVQNINNKDTTMVLGDREKTIYGPGYIEDELLGKRFRISSRSFYQVNSLQTEKLYRIAIDAAGLSGKEIVLDAYCGIATIGICAAGFCRKVIGAELNPEAVKDALINVRINNADNVTIVNEDAGSFISRLAERETNPVQEMDQGQEENSPVQPDVIFMDPPRSGSSEEFLKSLCELQPAKVVYISCNPETLARDLEYLTAHGYQMKKAVPVDMFPYTREVEVVSLLQKMSNTWESVPCRSKYVPVLEQFKYHSETASMPPCFRQIP